MRTLLIVAALTAIYMLALASTEPADVAVGALVAAGALAVARRAPEGPRTGGLRSVLWLGPYLGAVLVDVARGTWEVALVVLGIQPLRRPGIVEVPIGERTEMGTVAATLAGTLSPGEVLIDIDTERGVYVLHVLDATDEDAIRAAHRRGYLRYQRRTLP